MHSLVDINPAELSKEELLSLIKRQQDEIGQKEKHIDHLLSNAQKWTKKLEQSQAQASVSDTSDTQNTATIQEIQNNSTKLVQEKQQLQQQLNSTKSQYKKLLACVSLLEQENTRLAKSLTKLTEQQRPELDVGNVPVFNEEQTTLMEFSKDAKSIFAKYSS